MQPFVLQLVMPKSIFRGPLDGQFVIAYIYLEPVRGPSTEN